MLSASEASGSSVLEVLQKMRANGDGGISAGEAERRRRVHGYNELIISEEEPIWRKYINQVYIIVYCSILVLVYTSTPGIFQIKIEMTNSNLMAIWCCK